MNDEWWVMNDEWWMMSGEGWRVKSEGWWRVLWWIGGSVQVFVKTGVLIAGRASRRRRVAVPRGTAHRPGQSRGWSVPICRQDIYIKFTDRLFSALYSSLFTLNSFNLYRLTFNSPSFNLYRLTFNYFPIHPFPLFTLHSSLFTRLTFNV